MRKYAVLITFLLLLLVPAELYADSDDQLRWNTTLYGAIFLPGPEVGIGGSVGYSFLSRLELEGEGFFMLYYSPRYYGVSIGLLYNYKTAHYKLLPYILGGVSKFGTEGDVWTYLMGGGGIKWDMKGYKIKCDFRLYLGEGWWTKLSIGLMWSF